MALEKELETFKSKLPELKAAHEGKFALVHGEEIVDVFSSYDDAIKSGYSRFGLEPFLVKRIHAVEQVHFIDLPGTQTAPLAAMLKPSCHRCSTLEVV